MGTSAGGRFTYPGAGQYTGLASFLDSAASYIDNFIVGASPTTVDIGSQGDKSYLALTAIGANRHLTLDLASLLGQIAGTGLTVQGSSLSVDGSILFDPSSADGVRITWNSGTSKFDLDGSGLAGDYLDYNGTTNTLNVDAASIISQVPTGLSGTKTYLPLSYTSPKLAENWDVSHAASSLFGVPGLIPYRVPANGKLSQVDIVVANESFVGTNAGLFVYKAGVGALCTVQTNNAGVRTVNNSAQSIALASGDLLYFIFGETGSGSGDWQIESTTFVCAPDLAISGGVEIEWL